MASTVIEVRDQVTAPRNQLQQEREEAQLPPPLPSVADIDGLPPLFSSLTIEGLPSPHHCICPYSADGEKVVLDYISRWPIPSMKYFFLVGLSLTSLAHWVAISVDRLVAVGILYGVLFCVDDLLIDNPNDDLLTQYGIPASLRGSPEQIKEYYKLLVRNYAQEEAPTQNPLEVIMWEVGRDMLRMSNPDFFRAMVDSLDTWFVACADSYGDIVSGESLCVQDLESYSVMREGNFGGWFVQAVQEFVTDTYIPVEIRSLPFMLELRSRGNRQMAFINDLYSYHKERTAEAGNPRNVVTVLMETQGKTFVQAVHAAIEIINNHARFILDQETKTSDVHVRIHLQSLKDVMAGHINYSASQSRYRDPNNVFPELRDVDISSSQPATYMACHPQAGAAPLPSTGLTLRT